MCLEIAQNMSYNTIEALCKCQKTPHEQRVGRNRKGNTHMANKKNAVVVGYGGMGGWHTRYMLTSDAINLLGIYDIKQERADLAEQNGIHAYATWEEVLADPKVDFVTLAVPNELHKPLAIEAMSRGKHVVSEKPVTLCSEDLQEMIDAANRCGVLFTVHQNRRWDEDFLVVKKLLQVEGQELAISVLEGQQESGQPRKDHLGT